MSEDEEAIVLANKILDRPSGDPDDDLAMLSRQLLRTKERADKYRDVLLSMERRAFPFKCECCEQTMESTNDYDWHGIGNCVDICPTCTGAGWVK